MVGVLLSFFNLDMVDMTSDRIADSLALEGFWVGHDEQLKARGILSF